MLNSQSEHLQEAVEQLEPQSCSPLPPEHGNWCNVDTETSNIICIELVLQSHMEVIDNNQLHSQTIRLYGTCPPKDYDWGKVQVRRSDSGYYYAVYRQGFANRYVYAKMSRYRPNQLWLHIHTNFLDPAREDYVSRNWLVRKDKNEKHN